MSFILTLVASDRPLTAQHVAAVTNYAASSDIGLSGIPDWLALKKAVDIPLTEKLPRKDVESLWNILAQDRIDLFVTASEKRFKKLLLADMDATIVTGETLDEIAALAGMGDRVAAITARAMRGDLDFPAALRERVAMLGGQDSAILHATLRKLELSQGAAGLTRGMAASGAVCVLVSGGFTFFTEKIAAAAGFHHHHGNVLGVENGRLTGTVAEPILGREAKLDYLRQYARRLKLDMSETMAIGDGANDLPMLQAAGLGIGYRPKPLLRRVLDNCILYGDLTTALYAQGYRGENSIHDRTEVQGI